jgi:hypothetical protein
VTGKGKSPSFLPDSVLEDGGLFGLCYNTKHATIQTLSAGGGRMKLTVKRAVWPGPEGPDIVHEEWSCGCRVLGSLYKDKYILWESMQVCPTHYVPPTVTRTPFCSGGTLNPDMVELDRWTQA